MAHSEHILSLADLEAFDEGEESGRQYRYCCPLPDCSDKRIDSDHRSLSVQIESGLWYCHRCRHGGKLREFWSGGARRTRVVPSGFRLGSSGGAEAGAPFDGRAEITWQFAGDVRSGPAAAYLWQRGIDPTMAQKALCRYERQFFGRGAILFPLFDQNDEVAGLNGRYIDSYDPKTRVMGRANLGVFATGDGVFDRNMVVITEAPLDALSCAMAGFPAIAFCGVGIGPDWLAMKLAWKRVVVAFDNDEAGDWGAEKLAVHLQRLGAETVRFRPSQKDCNDVLVHGAKHWLRQEIEQCLPSDAWRPLPLIARTTRTVISASAAHPPVFAVRDQFAIDGIHLGDHESDCPTADTEDMLEDYSMPGCLTCEDVGIGRHPDGLGLFCDDCWEKRGRQVSPEEIERFLAER